MCQHGGQLVELCNADLLPYLDFFQWDKLLDRVMHHLCTDKELFGLFLCDLTGTLGFLLGAQALVLLQLRSSSVSAYALLSTCCASARALARAASNSFSPCWINSSRFF